VSVPPADGYQSTTAPRLKKRSRFAGNPGVLSASPQRLLKPQLQTKIKTLRLAPDDGKIYLWESYRTLGQGPEAKAK
jgi:hypothetical protein